MKAFVFTNICELREKAGLFKRVVASRLFPGKGSEHLAAYEEGTRSTFYLNPVSLLPLAEALGCGVTDLKTEK